MYRPNWANIPLELRERAQWCFTNPNAEDGQKKAPRKRGGYRASKTDPTHWMTFEEACFNAEQFGGEVGFCLSESDPFTCIDLDVKNSKTHPDKPWLWTTQSDMDRHWKIAQTFDSFTELSAGGLGLHIWLYGDVGKGAHFGPTEVYSRDAFIICTGNVVLPRLMAANDELLSILYNEIREQQGAVMGYDNIAEGEEVKSDDDIFQIGMSAQNADKFNHLCSLKVEDASKFYPSNSEADLALLSIFAYYTKSNNQVKRLFRYCPLSHREKSQENDVYLDRTLAGIRRKQAENEAKTAYVDKATLNILDKHVREARIAQEIAKNATPTSPVPTNIPPVPPTPEQIISDLTEIPLPSYVTEQMAIEFPTGNLGLLARWMTATAQRPIGEIGIASALAFYSGLCGLKFSINDSGLNLYIVVIGRSGIGKENLHNAIGRVCNEVRGTAATIDKRFDSQDYRSRPAMMKEIAHRRSYLHLFNEWGKMLESMNNDRDHNAADIRRTMLSLFHKSDVGSVVGGAAYSDKEKNVDLNGPASYAMVGETTPDTFYAAISGSMFEDGTFSRFLHIETTANRGPLNPNRAHPFPSQLQESISSISNLFSDDVYSDSSRIPVLILDEARNRYTELENEFTDIMNANPDDTATTMMYTRAGIKILRIAALLAVSNNHSTPQVSLSQIEWAYKLVKLDIDRTMARVAAGEIGTGEMNRIKMVRSSMRLAFKNIAMFDARHRNLIKDGLIPLSVIRQLCVKSINFKDKGNLSPTRMVDMALNALVDSGDVIEVPKPSLISQYNYTGKAFALKD